MCPQVLISLRGLSLQEGGQTFQWSIVNTGHEVEEVLAQVRLNWTGGLEFRPKGVLIACFGFAKSILGVWRFLVGGGFALGLLDVLERCEFPCEDPSGSPDPKALRTASALMKLLTSLDWHG